MYRLICMWQDGNQYTTVFPRYKDVWEHLSEFENADKRDIVVITIVKINA